VQVTETLHQPVLIMDEATYDSDVEALYDKAFGPGRHAKAAARLREGNVSVRTCSVLARGDGAIVGACRMWPIVADDSGKALFLGPIAVDSAYRSVGLGRTLVQACLERAGDDQVVILVGDMAYFQASGFDIVPSGQVTMPGPVDPKRLLWRTGQVAQSDWPKGKLTAPRATSQTS
jgi:predicted N-acetyltransferase YhbS